MLDKNAHVDAFTFWSLQIHVCFQNGPIGMACLQRTGQSNLKIVSKTCRISYYHFSPDI